MILVRIRCKARGCGKLLTTVDRTPADWSGVLAVPPCPRHDVPRRGTFIRWARSQRRAGRSGPFMLMTRKEVRWETLRASIEKAQRVGRVVDVAV